MERDLFWRSRKTLCARTTKQFVDNYLSNTFYDFFAFCYSKYRHMDRMQISYEYRFEFSPWIIISINCLPSFHFSQMIQFDFGGLLQWLGCGLFIRASNHSSHTTVRTCTMNFSSVCRNSAWNEILLLSFIHQKSFSFADNVLCVNSIIKL